MNCLFCKIINQDIPSFKIYEDDLVYAFLDINPKCNGHTLIIPKNHTLDLFSIDNDILLHVLEVARTLSKELMSKLGADGITLGQNNGDVQEVKHFHLHLIPYYNENQEIISVEEIYNKLRAN